MRLRSAGLRMGTFSSPHSLAPMLGKGCHFIAIPISAAARTMARRVAA